MKIDLISFSKAIKKIFSGKKSENVKEVLEKVGGHEFKISVKRENGKINLKFPGNDIVSSFKVIKRIFPQSYDLTIKCVEEGKTKTLSQKGHKSKSIEDMRNQMLRGRSIGRTYYEMIEGEGVEITSSKHEGVIIEPSNDKKLEKFLDIYIGTLPFIEPEEEFQKATLEFNFDLEESDEKNFEYEGEVKCKVSEDDEVMGTKRKKFLL